jgi:hypothetical protein
MDDMRAWERTVDLPRDRRKLDLHELQPVVHASLDGAANIPAMIQSGVSSATTLLGTM